MIKYGNLPSTCWLDVTTSCEISWLPLQLPILAKSVTGSGSLQLRSPPPFYLRS